MTIPVWFPTNLHSPPLEDPVLAWWPSVGVHVARYHRGRGWRSAEFGRMPAPAYWMQLPAPPVELRGRAESVRL